MLGLLLPALLQAVPAPPVAELVPVQRLAAPEARQGVVADRRFVYVVANAEIGKYDRASGRRVAHWRGDSEHFRHMNSCILRAARIVCAASNYPEVPQASSIEWFDTARMRHVASRSLGPGRGSLTWLDWHDGSWWACFAQYDGKGGEPGRDHRDTTLVRFDAHFAEQGAWLFPQEVLARLAPYSSSGGVWGKDGLLYVTGHDRPELYALRLPRAGSRLEWVATLAMPTGGQAIAWDRLYPRHLWSIERSTREAVLSRVPPVAGPGSLPTGGMPPAPRAQ